MCLTVVISVRMIFGYVELAVNIILRFYLLLSKDFKC